MQLPKDNLSVIIAQKAMQDLLEELKSERDQVRELSESNSKLEQDYRNALREASQRSEKDLIGHSKTGSALSDQLSDSVNTRLIRLELENEQLRSKLSSTNSSGQLVSSSSIPSSTAASTTTQSPSSTSISSEISQNQEIQRLTLELDAARKSAQSSAAIARDLQSSLDTMSLQKQSADSRLTTIETDLQTKLDRAETRSTQLDSELRSLREDASRVAAAVAVEASKPPPPSADYVSSLENQLIMLRRDLTSVTDERTDLTQRLSEARTDAETTRQELDTLSTRISETEAEKLVVEQRVYERDRNNRWLEKENLKLKQLLEVSDADFEKQRTRIAELERDESRLSASTKAAEEAGARAAELEVERRHLAAQLEFRTKSLDALRSDLIEEKSRLSSVQAQLQGVAACLGLRSEDLLADGAGRLESILVDTIQQLRSSSEREVETAKSRLRSMEEERDDTMKQLRGRSQTSLADSSQQTEEFPAEAFTDTSERLKSMEVRNTLLCDENRHVKEQVRLLQEQIRRTQQEASSYQTEATAAKRELSEIRTHKKRESCLSSENAKLAVEARSNQLKAELFESDNCELQKQLLLLEKDHQALRQNFGQMQKMNAELGSDHEMLQSLHAQLTRDYEAVCGELTETKAALKAAQLDYHSLDARKEALEREQAEVVRLKSRLESDVTVQGRDIRQLATLQNEHGALKRAHDDAKARCDSLRGELESIQADRRNLRERLNAATIRETRYQGQLAEIQEANQEYKMYANEMDQRCDMLEQLNATVKEECRTLMRQADVLVKQNSELFTRALLDKDTYHAEEKELQEKLNTVRRQKEKLEEKIMDQYKTMDSPNKGKKNGTNFTKRMKALISRTESSRKLPSGNGSVSGKDSEDSGSGHGGNNTDGGGGGNRSRDTSLEDVLGRRRLEDSPIVSPVPSKHSGRGSKGSLEGLPTPRRGSSGDILDPSGITSRHADYAYPARRSPAVDSVGSSSTTRGGSTGVVPPRDHDVSSLSGRTVTITGLRDEQPDLIISSRDSLRKRGTSTGSGADGGLNVDDAYVNPTRGRYAPSKLRSMSVKDSVLTDGGPPFPSPHPNRLQQTTTSIAAHASPARDPLLPRDAEKRFDAIHNSLRLGNSPAVGGSLASRLPQHSPSRRPALDQVVFRQSDKPASSPAAKHSKSRLTFYDNVPESIYPHQSTRHPISPTPSSPSTRASLDRPLLVSPAPSVDVAADINSSARSSYSYNYKADELPISKNISSPIPNVRKPQFPTAQEEEDERIRSGAQKYLPVKPAALPLPKSGAGGLTSFLRGDRSRWSFDMRPSSRKARTSTSSALSNLDKSEEKPTGSK